MALIVVDRVVETTTTTGTGALTLAGAVTGYHAFSAKMSVGDTCYYCIEAIDSSGTPTGDWETGLGTYSATNTLTRTTVSDSSNSGAAVSFATGTKRVFISAIAGSTGSTGTDKARAYLNTATNTATSWTKVPLDTIDWDTNSIWDSTNKRFTVKKAGYYQVNARIRTNNNGSFAMAVAKNGSINHALGGDAGTSLVAAEGGSLMINCAVSDYLELWCIASNARAFTTGTFDTFMEVFGPV